MPGNWSDQPYSECGSMFSMTPRLPTCCSPLVSIWPLPTALAGATLISCQFDHSRLLAGDFQAATIAVPASIQRAVSKRQAEYLAGRLCAREALRRVTGRADVPALGDDRAPVWPSNVSGSITHGAGLAAAIVAPNPPWLSLGLDLEALLPTPRAARLAAEILTPGELQRLRLLPAEARAERVTLTFSLKESLFKALYPLVRKRFYFEHAELLDVDERGQARLRLLLDLDQQWRAGSELNGEFGMLDGRLLSLIAIPNLI